MSTIAQRNRRTGILLSIVVLGLFLYSFLIIRYRGHEQEPKNSTRLERLWRGL